MAEISTIARPYAEALMRSVKDSQDSELANKLIAALETLSSAVSLKEVQDVISDPAASAEQIHSLLRSMLSDSLPAEADNLLKLLIDNGRLTALPELTSQFIELVRADKSEAEVIIETPYPINETELQSLLAALSRKFTGVKLLPKLVIDKSLIGGVKVTVGDKVLDGTVKARLAEMHAALTR